MPMIRPLMFLVGSLVMPRLASKPTNECFLNRNRYFLRFGELKGLPETQSDQGESNIFCYCQQVSATFRRIIEQRLGLLESESRKLETRELGQRFRRLGLNVTLPTIEDMAKIYLDGQREELFSRGGSNFFFVDDDAQGTQVIEAHFIRQSVDIIPQPLDHDGKWPSDSRCFFRDEVFEPLSC